MGENGQGKSFEAMDWDELMAFEAEKSQPLSLTDVDAKRFHYRTILYKMDQGNYKIPLLTEPGSGAEFLNEILAEITADDYLLVGPEAYEITTKGEQELQTMAEQYHSLVAHYDIFCAVDLDNACFLEPGDDPQEKVEVGGRLYERWLDLRVAVMRFKGISPFDMVFLNLLREGRIGAKPNWEFDLALGKELYREVEEIVNSAYTLSDLTALKMQNDHGDIPGSDILKDVILAGNELNQERKLAQQAKKGYDAPEVQKQMKIHVVHEHRGPMFKNRRYDPYGYYESYRDPFYVEPCWRSYQHKRYF